MPESKQILWFEDLNLTDLPTVGGKNASLGEMSQTLRHAGIVVPGGFATSSQMYREFLSQNNLDEPIQCQLELMQEGSATLSETGQTIRDLIMGAHFIAKQSDAIVDAYKSLCQRINNDLLDVAVRSSATAEDLPQASFAGQQESYLNVRGASALLLACQQCFASLYTDRAIAYREEQGFEHQQVALSVGVQQMVRSDLAGAGVMFSIDTESGFPDSVLINAAWGLGETVVKGSVNPDRMMVYKPFLKDPQLSPIIEKSLGSKLEKMVYAQAGDPELTKTLATSKQERQALVLNDGEILQLARWALAIEDHYARPMDIEWAKDGNTGELFIVQARPETIESRKDHSVLVNYKLRGKSEVLVTGASVGSAIATGKAYYLADPKDSEEFPEGALLVTERTDPDWVPVMRKAAGIITDTGGPTSHAAIVSRELKVPAIVGTGNATKIISSGTECTLSCAQGSVGKVYAGQLPFETSEIQLDSIPKTRTDILINAALPDAALRWWQLPVAGIGLTRIEFIISSQIRVHPMALLHPERVSDDRVREKIQALASGYEPLSDYFVDNLAQGIGKIAASCYPRPVVVRMSDFKSNEYRGLLGGEDIEIKEENPMLGLRGASRYYHPLYQEAFQLECQAIKQVREVMGFDNVIIMIPFCRTPEEADRVLEELNKAGLQRGVNDLEVYVMCEIPSNIILAEEFSQRFDGFSIGSNDLTQLVLGIDRDSVELKPLFDARNDAVKRMIEQVIKVAHVNGCKVGICGQAPSDHPEFAEFLVECGIDSISLNPDSVPIACEHVAAAEKRLLEHASPVVG